VQPVRYTRAAYRKYGTHGPDAVYEYDSVRFVRFEMPAGHHAAVADEQAQRPSETESARVNGGWRRAGRA